MFEALGLMVFYENMLALNNVSLTCGQNQIVGVFGANSAGKSTLMYTLSGIMEDIAKKEQMAGGERITLRGSINFEGRGDHARQARRPGPGGHHPLPRAAAHLPGKLGAGEPEDRGLPGQGRPGRRDPGVRVQDLPAADQDHAPPGRLSLRRRAADAGHRPGPHGPAPGCCSWTSPCWACPRPSSIGWPSPSRRSPRSGGWPSSWPSSTPGPSCPSSTTATSWRTARR